MNQNHLLLKRLHTAAFATALLFGTSAVFAQVKIGTNPTTIDPANNLEVEASTPGRKVSVDKTSGKVTIADGSQGVTKVLTSDANGVATWEAPVQTASVYVYARAGSQAITASNTNGGFNKLNLDVEAADRGGNYNPATSEITVPSAGLYLITAGTSKSSATTGGICISLNLMVNNAESWENLVDGGTGCGVANDGPYHLRGSVLRQFEANDKIYLALRSLPSTGTATIGFGNSFLKFVKLSN